MLVRASGDEPPKAKGVRVSVLESFWNEAAAAVTPKLEVARRAVGRRRVKVE